MSKFSFGNSYYPDDEYYTPRETAEYLVDKYFPGLQGKRIILPCDNENSELYKVCKERGLKCECSQDMFNTDYDSFDLVFTNPPFSMITKFVRYLDSINKKFLLFAPGPIISSIISLKVPAYYVEDFRNKGFVNFVRPDGTFKGIHGGLITNLDEGRKVVESKPSLRIQPTNEGQTYKGIYLDAINCNYLDYDGMRSNVKGNGLLVRKKQ